MSSLEAHCELVAFGGDQGLDAVDLVQVLGIVDEDLEHAVFHGQGDPEVFSEINRFQPGKGIGGNREPVVERHVPAVVILGQGSAHVRFFHLHLVDKDGLHAGALAPGEGYCAFQFLLGNYVIGKKVVEPALFSGLFGQFGLIEKGDTQHLGHLHGRVLVLQGEAGAVLFVDQL